jgi:lactoylglutathione lyase
LLAGTTEMEMRTNRIRATALLLGLCAALGGALVTADEPPSREVLTRGLNHVGLTVTDLGKSTAFFTKTLNWRDVGGDPDYPAKFVTDGELFLTLWQVTNPATAVAFDRKNNVGLHHLALTVASNEALDELHERFLGTEGVVIEFAPELNGPGPTRHMMIREPSGNRIEFAFNPPRE